MRKIFLDIGAHIGESVMRFCSEMKDVDDYEIYSFEPDSYSYRVLKFVTKSVKNITLLNVAVGSDGSMNFYKGGTNMNEGGTTEIDKRTGEIDYKHPTKVKSVLLSKWLKENVSPDDYIILKINAEGGEYIIMQDLLAEGVDYIDKILIQTHFRKFSSPKKEEFQRIEEQFKKNMKTELFLYDKENIPFTVKKIPPGDYPFQFRKYESYDKYLEHQKTKYSGSDISWFSKYKKKYVGWLSILLPRIGFNLKNTCCLCVGARQGTEVSAFNKMGSFAVGIDIYPGEDNKYVVVGDVKNIQYADNSVDIVFTNSLDHFLEVDKALSEMKRVLKPDGHFVMLMTVNSKNDKYASTTWNYPKEVIDYIINKYGYVLEKRVDMNATNWFSDFVVFRASNNCL